MDEKAAETALVPAQADFQVAPRGVVSLWASATTSGSERRADLLRDKQRIVLAFFKHTGKLPSEVEPADVQGGLRDLEGKGISAGTCYQHACLALLILLLGHEGRGGRPACAQKPGAARPPQSAEALPD